MLFKITCLTYADLVYILNQVYNWLTSNVPANKK